MYKLMDGNLNGLKLKRLKMKFGLTLKRILMKFINRISEKDPHVKQILDGFLNSDLCFSSLGRISELKSNYRTEVVIKPLKNGKKSITLNKKKFYLSRVLAILFLPDQIKKYHDKEYLFNELDINHIKDRDVTKKEIKGSKSDESISKLEVLTRKEHALKDKKIIK